MGVSGEGWRERKCPLTPPPQTRGTAAGRLTVPKDVHMLRPLPGKWDFTDVIKLRWLRWGKDPGFSGES